MRWTSAKCWSCGWEAPRIQMHLAVEGKCPYCGKKDLHPR